MATLDGGRRTRKRGGHRHPECSVCAPEPTPSAPPQPAADERFWLDSGDLIHPLPAPDRRPEPTEPPPSSDAST
jgi:hypothetical protein